MKEEPWEVAEYCDWPINEADLHARHQWLHGRLEFRERMKSEPDFYDCKIAGYWIWGLSCWIGDAFCRPACGSSPNLAGSKGVVRQLPDVVGTYGATKSHRGEPTGKGCRAALKLERKRPALASWKCMDQADALASWFDRLAERLRFTKVCCGDWARVCTKAATFGQGLTGVVLDPPYARAMRDENIYAHESDGLSDRVRAWAIENANNPLLRIALCGYEGEHDMPLDWECVAWKAAGGYGNRNPENKNAELERIWFSPHCLKPQAELFDLKEMTA